jgi:hypothetical protein
MKLTKKCDFCTKIFDVEKNKIDKQRFCDPVCKDQFHSYIRSYAGILINSGELDFQTVKEQIDKKQLGLKIGKHF